jgi:hypothetical protein
MSRLRCLIPRKAHRSHCENSGKHHEVAGTPLGFQWRRTAGSPNSASRDLHLVTRFGNDRTHCAWRVSGSRLNRRRRIFVSSAVALAAFISELA